LAHRAGLRHDAWLVHRTLALLWTAEPAQHLFLAFGQLIDALLQPL
jgi:hypothetical protein